MVLLRAASASLRGASRRGLCATAAEAPQVMFGTSGRYANALYAAASKKKVLEDVEADLTLLKATLTASPALKAFCSDPSLNRETKSKGIVDILTAAKANEVTKNTMATLAENGRLGMVSKVIDMYGELMNASKGEMTAIITSAEPLAAAELSDITKQLSLMLDGKKMATETKVDSALVSGFTVEIGDKFLDYSVATQLKKLQALLKDM